MRTRLFAYVATLTVSVVMLLPATVAAQSMAGSDPQPVEKRRRIGVAPSAGSRPVKAKVPLGAHGRS